MTTPINITMPTETFTVTYCDKCGRDNHIQQLRERHFANGEPCKGGTLKAVTYRRDDSTIRNASDDNL